MGSKLSIDKTVSELDDILAMNPSYFRKIKFENRSPLNIAHHLKLWKFTEKGKGSKQVVSKAISLQQIKTKGFLFKPTESYVVFLIYRKDSLNDEVLESLPNSTWALIESYSNLTPRGQEVPVSSSEKLSDINREILDSFTISKSNAPNSNIKNFDKFEYMLFVWNGKTADALLRSIALWKAYELENFIKKATGPFLEVLFSGGIFKDNRLRTGSILQLISNQNKQYNNKGEFNTMKDKVFLFKFLFPKKRSFPIQNNRILLEKFSMKDDEFSLFYQDDDRKDEESDSYENLESKRLTVNDKLPVEQKAMKGINIPNLKLGSKNLNGFDKVEFRLDLNGN